MILLAKHKTVILAAFAITTAAAVMGVRAMPPTYQTSAKVLVRIDQETIPSFFSGIAASREPATIDSGLRRLENEIQMMEAYPLSAQVVADVGLTYEQVYHPPLTHLVTWIRKQVEQVQVRYFDRQPSTKQPGPRETAEAFRKSLSVKLTASKTAESGADVLEVTLRGVDPALTAKALDRLLEIYTTYDRKMNVEIGQRAYNVVRLQAEQAKATLAAAQARLGEYIATNGPPAHSSAPDVIVDGGATRDGLANRLSPPIRANAVLSSPGDSSPIALLKGRLMAMEIDLVSLQRNYAGRTEQIRTLQGSIAELKQRLDREQRRAAENETTLLALDREMRMGEALSAELERRLSQIGFFLAINNGGGGNRVVIEPPLVPQDSNSRSAIILSLLASLAGLVLGLGLAGLSEMMDHRLETEADVRDELGVPVLAVIPRARRRERRRTLRIGQVLAAKEA